MTDPKSSADSPRSRRRFLADLLFVGGGLTAAGLLAKSSLPKYHPEPQSPGNMVAPTPPPPEPQPNTPGKMAIPNPVPDGDVAMPEPTPPCEKPVPIESEPVPHPAGAPMPERPTR